MKAIFLNKIKELYIPEITRCELTRKRKVIIQRVGGYGGQKQRASKNANPLYIGGPPRSRTEHQWIMSPLIQIAIGDFILLIMSLRLFVLLYQAIAQLCG
ncbi:MAG TPA: hypothetical protein VEF04_04950 [Blastocatellia bacterium]|nr:hypothetical protein [Blastocatellia bacterium]